VDEPFNYSEKNGGDNIISAAISITALALNWSISSLMLLATFLYALYISVLWFTASVGYWKGYPTDLNATLMVALYGLPPTGILLANIASCWCPSLVDGRVTSVVTGIGGSFFLGAVILLCLPIVSINL
jgi:hypothetical protein